MNRRGLIIGAGATMMSRHSVRGDAIRSSVTWPDDHVGAVSFTYDDGLSSHLDIAQPLLEQRGVRGTFYVTMRNIEARLADWAGASTRGHELANHTMNHPCDLQLFAPDAFVAREVAPMEAWLRQVSLSARVPTFAYPCDVTNLGGGDANRQARRYERLLALEGIVAARTSEGEPNSAATALRQPYRLQALAVGYDAPDYDTVAAYLAAAAQRRRWAILVFHDLVDAAQEAGQVSNDMHSRILDKAAELRLWCAPLGQVFAGLSRRQSGVT